jgi:hypothetical protein
MIRGATNLVRRWLSAPNRTPARGRHAARYRCVQVTVKRETWLREFGAGLEE